MYSQDSWQKRVIVECFESYHVFPKLTLMIQKCKQSSWYCITKNRIRRVDVIQSCIFISFTSGSQSLRGIWVNVNELQSMSAYISPALLATLLRLLLTYNRRECERLEVVPSLDSRHESEAMQEHTVTSVSMQMFRFLQKLIISVKGKKKRTDWLRNYDLFVEQQLGCLSFSAQMNLIIHSCKLKTEQHRHSANKHTVTYVLSLDFSILFG